MNDYNDNMPQSEGYAELGAQHPASQLANFINAKAAKVSYMCSILLNHSDGKVAARKAISDKANADARKAINHFNN